MQIPKINETDNLVVRFGAVCRMHLWVFHMTAVKLIAAVRFRRA